jgi:hypothetical protein
VVEQTLEDKDILALLQAAIARGDVEVSLDIKKQHHIDSPVYRENDSSWAVYALMLTAAAITYFFGWQIGLGAFVVAVLIYLLVIRRLVAKRMRRRLLVEVLAKPEDFRKAWKLKGIGFLHTASGASCESPDARWRSFILERCRPQQGDKPAP